VRLTPREQDRLTIFLVAELARSRRTRGVKLNAPEAAALIADAVCEAARDGATLADAIAAGRAAVCDGDVLDGVTSILRTIEVEALFDDGTRLAVIHDPISAAQSGPDAPGAVLVSDQPISYTLDNPITVAVTNTAAVPIAVTSHYHFFEANPRLRFDRDAAYGRRLAIPAGASVRFAAGETRDVTLVAIGGDRIVIGCAGLVDGPLDAPGTRDRALATARACGYQGA
jgi:urease subunit gamma/beta